MANIWVCLGLKKSTVLSISIKWSIVLFEEKYYTSLIVIIADLIAKSNNLIANSYYLIANSTFY